MMMREKRDIRPVLLKFGVALAFSLGGILYSFLRTKRIKSSGSSSSHTSSGEERVEVNHEGDDHASQKILNSCHSTSTAPEKDESLLLLNSNSESFACNVSPSKRSSGDKDTYLLPEFNDLVEEFDLVAIKGNFSPRKDLEVVGPSSATVSSNERLDQDQEINRLRNALTTLTERERSLEIQLLEYYGLKEQETNVMELQNRLKINNMEAKLFNLKVESLQADKRRLEEQLTDYAKVVSELEVAKVKIKLFRKKLRSEAEQNREQILALKERVAKVQEQEKKALLTDSGSPLKLQKVKDFEEAAEELRKSNESLRVENSSLAQKLEYVQALATSVLDDEQTQASRDESNRLRLQNEEMAREIEQLQAARCSDIEELVYLRWINACLRYELRNYQAGPGKTTARDLRRSLSPKSEERAKKLILEYAHKEGAGEKGIDVANFDSGRWSSSQASFLSDSGENDDSSIHVSTNKTNTSTKPKLFSKLMNILRGKGSQGLKRSSSLEVTPSTEDMAGSPRCSAGVSPGTISVADGFAMRSRASSRRSSSLSLDLQRSPHPQGSRSLKGEEDGINLEGGPGKSNDGSSFVYRVTNPIAEDVTGLTEENRQHRQGQKSALEKYADALKDSRRKPYVRKRSVSVTF